MLRVLANHVHRVASIFSNTNIKYLLFKRAKFFWTCMFFVTVLWLSLLPNVKAVGAADATIQVATASKNSIPSALQVQDKPTLTLCMEDGFWAPYLFVANGEPAGIHVAMLQQAFQNLPYKLAIHTMPWKRCLDGAKLGRIDAVLAASYTEERATYLLFPEGNLETETSPYRIMGVQYVVVSSIDTPEWEGKEEQLPEPIGVPMGYATAERLMAQGLKVTEGLRYDDLFRMLMRDRVGSLVIVRELADLYLDRSPYKGALKTHENPYETRSLYLPFARAGNLPEAERTAIWKAISAVRNDAELMRAIKETAINLSQDCFDTPDHCH